MTALDTNTVLLVIAALNCVTAIFAYLAHRASNSAARLLVVTALNIQKIETATNSMKDALVQTTATVAKAEGVVLGRAQVIDERKE